MIAEMLQYIIESSQDFTKALSQHLYLTFFSLGISIFLGLTFGILATRIKRLRTFLLFSASIGRTIPSLAILAIAIPLLGIGAPPTILALVLIGTLPVLINTTVGIEQVSDSIKESARGMGMTNLQVLVKVELPIAISIIMAGIRTSAVLLVASATLGAFIGAGGLGDLILRGHALNKDHIVLAGAIPATLLAFYFEEIFGRLEKWATPIGLKIGLPGFSRKQMDSFELLSAILVFPLVFGALSPWLISRTAGESTIILTGLHPEYQFLAGSALIFGIVGALFIKPQQSAQPLRMLGTQVFIQAAGLAIMTYLLAQIFLNTPAGHQIQTGIFLQFGGHFALFILALLELVLRRRTR